MFEIIYLIFMILFLFGITIFVHEWGHFIVARKCGLKVEAFAIGMGPALIKKTIDEVEYKLCLISNRRIRITTTIRSKWNGKITR